MVKKMECDSQIEFKEDNDACLSLMIDTFDRLIKENPDDVFEFEANVIKLSEKLIKGIKI